MEQAANKEIENPTEIKDTKKKSGSLTETLNKTETSKRKRLIKGKGKVTKKSLATNSLNVIKAIEQDEEKEVENPKVETLQSIEGENTIKAEAKGNGEKVGSTAEEEDDKEKVKSPTEDTRKKLRSHAKTCNKEESSKKTRLLKAKGKIIKKSSAVNSLSTIKAKDSSKVQGKQKMTRGIKKTAIQGNLKSGGNEEVVTNLSSMDDKKKTNTEEQDLQNSNLTLSDIEKMGEPQKSCIEVKNEKNSGTSDTNPRNEKMKEKFYEEEKSELDKNNEEKFGGFIFMCSGKTKPDCFRYQVMGVSNSKKDIVLAIKPGLKLFLYDFALKLLYGIYEASSTGGIKLEPTAFNGFFPAQVRFKVHKDCFPLPESVFKEAIKENYFEKYKFKTELTFKQVSKLTELFRLADYRSSLAPPRVQDTEVYGRARGSRYADSFANNADSRSYHLPANQRDREIALRERSLIRREEISRDVFLSEKEYRSYGLQRERQNLPPGFHPEYHGVDPLYLDGKQHLAYNLQSDPPPSSSVSRGLTSSDAKEPYIVPNQPVPPLDHNLPGPRREEAAHLTNAPHVPSHYNQTLGFHETKRETVTMPVSSRYAFAGPSFSHR